MDKFLIGLDEGTTSCKACIFDLDGNLIAQDYREYRCIYYPDKPGFVEQDADEITETLFACVKSAIEKSGVDRNNIQALGLSSQGSCVGICDNDGSMLYNWIGWQDLRGFMVADKLPEIMSSEEMVAETNGEASGFSALAKHLWMKTFMPDTYEKADHVVTMQEYFLKKFGADSWVTDAASVSRESIGNLESHNYSQKIFDAYGMDMTKRGRRVENGFIAGKVSPEIAEKTGLPVGCKICVGAMDQCCSPFGSGMVNDGDTVIVMGTFGACYVCSDKLLNIKNGSLTWKSHLYFENGAKNYTAEALSFASASAYRWFRDIICTKEAADAKNDGEDPYELINKLIASSVPGAHGVTFLPFLQGRSYGYGEWQANMNSTCTFTGMRMSSSRADLARAVAEGILYEMRDIISVIKQHGLMPKNIRVTGGVTKSPVWCQMMADIFGESISILETNENGCLGAALFAGIGTGAYKDAYEAAIKAVRIKKTYAPNAENKAAYDEGFERFMKTYRHLESTN